MTWIELATFLRKLGVPEQELPSVHPKDGAYGLRIENGRYIVFEVDRTTPIDHAEFPSEAAAAEYALDCYKMSFALLGDTRRDDFRRGIINYGRTVESFGGKPIRKR